MKLRLEFGSSDPKMKAFLLGSHSLKENEELLTSICNDFGSTPAREWPHGTLHPSPRASQAGEPPVKVHVTP